MDPRLWLMCGGTPVPIVRGVVGATVVGAAVVGDVVVGGSVVGAIVVGALVETADGIPPTPAQKHTSQHASHRGPCRLRIFTPTACCVSCSALSALRSVVACVTVRSSGVTFGVAACAASVLGGRVHGRG